MRLAQAPGLLARLGGLGSNNAPRATQSAAFAARARNQRSQPNHVVLNAASASSGRRTGCASCTVPKATFMETFRVPSPHALAPHARGTLPRTRRQQTGGGLSEWLRGEGGEAAPSASEQAQSGFAESFAAHLQACRVLLLDVSFRPIDVLTWQRAITMQLFDKVEVLAYYDIAVRSARASHPVPAVLKVNIFIKPSKGTRLSVSRRNVLIRDRYACQFSGCASTADSIDHVLPVSRGGAWSWTNLVAACSKCNAKKGARTPAESKMPLKRSPREPSGRGALYTRLGYQSIVHSMPAEWEGYV